MTVTAIRPVDHAYDEGRDGGRLALTAADLVLRARRVIARCGHGAGDLGTPATGMSLEGAVYLAAGFYGGRHEIVDPVRCVAHAPRRRRVPPSPCEPGCEDPLWRQCNLAFAYLAVAVQTGRDRTPVLDEVRPSARDFGVVVEANDLLDTASALVLLTRVCGALFPGARQPSPMELRAAAWRGAA